MLGSGALMSAIGRPQNNPLTGNSMPNEDRIQSLRVWEPPEFCLAFFWYVSFCPISKARTVNANGITASAYPPSAPLLSHLLTPLHPFLTPLLHLSISSLLGHVSSSYAQLVKDRMVLSAEVMKEYDRRFVYKRIFGAKVDRGVQTHEGEYRITECGNCHTKLKAYGDTVRFTKQQCIL